MFSIWARRLVRVGWLLFLGTALTAVIPFGSTHAQNGQNAQNGATGVNHDCRTWEALHGKCAKADPNTDDVLDFPNLYTGRVATLEGRVDQVYSPTAFAMQDNYDLIPHGDRILMISVMPVGARSTTTTTTTTTPAPATRSTTTTTVTTDENAPVPAVEMVQLLQNGFEHGKIIKATGMVRMFDRAALEQEFGHIDFGTAPLDQFQNKPVLLLGAREFAQFQQQRVQQQAAVTPPEAQPIPEPAPEAQPAPQPQVEQPAPQPEPVQPAPEPAPQVQQPTTLPRTASPIPLVGLSGLLSLMLGMGIRLFRK